MAKWLQGIGAVLLLAGGLIMSSGCVGVGVRGGVGYDYDYYPDYDIYYYPQGHVWYWNEGGHWRSGGSLPGRYAVSGHPHQSMHFHTQQPWTERRP